MRSNPRERRCRVGPLAETGSHHDQHDAVIEEPGRFGDLLDAAHRIDQALVEHDRRAPDPTPAQFVVQPAALIGGRYGGQFRTVMGGRRAFSSSW